MKFRTRRRGGGLNRNGAARKREFAIGLKVEGRTRGRAFLFLLEPANFPRVSTLLDAIVVYIHTYISIEPSSHPEGLSKIRSPLRNIDYSICSISNTVSSQGHGTKQSNGTRCRYKSLFCSLETIPFGENRRECLRRDANGRCWLETKRNVSGINARVYSFGRGSTIGAMEPRNLEKDDTSWPVARGPVICLPIETFVSILTIDRLESPSNYTLRFQTNFFDTRRENRSDRKKFLST